MTQSSKQPVNLLVAMTGKASPAKAAAGDKPVFAYIASMPQPQRGMAYYGVEAHKPLRRVDSTDEKPAIQGAEASLLCASSSSGGWCFSCGAFVGHVKLMFIRGTELKPEPPVTPIGMGKATRGVDLATVEDLDEIQLASWMQQSAAIPFAGGKKR